MRVVVLNQASLGEPRVGLVPESVPLLLGAGFEVTVEPGAGSAAGFADEAYAAAGASVGTGDGDLHLGLRASRSPFLCLESPASGAGYALDRLPRISRAQPMDALTSQSLIVGYRGAIVAAGLLRDVLPLTPTAGLTLPAATVLVLGAGVAGLQAIATVHRMGARVQGYDVRASSAEEIASLGAVPLDLGLPPLTGAAGYAREMTPERALEQQARLAPHVAAADAVITTAAVPGRPAPILMTRAMVEAMRPGAVVVDLPGNVEGSVPGSLVQIGGVQVWGGKDVAGQLPGPASRLFSANASAFLELLARDPRDEIIRACTI